MKADGMKVALETQSLKYWGEDLRRPLNITQALPLWRALQGRLIHRPRHGRVYLHDRVRMSFTWLCGSTTNKPVPVKPECMEGLTVCGRCETLAATKEIT